MAVGLAVLAGAPAWAAPQSGAAAAPPTASAPSADRSVTRPAADLEPDRPGAGQPASRAALVAAGSPSAAKLALRRALGRRVTAALSTSGAGVVGAAVDVDGLGPVLRHNSAHALPPASTQKSFVVAAALLALPSDRRLATSVRTSARLVDLGAGDHAASGAGPTGGHRATGRLDGSVVLVAGGDPHLTRAGLRGLALSVRTAGVRHIAGDVLVDDSRYDHRRRAAGWKSSWMPGQSGPLSALAVDGNRWRRDRSFLADPAVPTAALFRDQLALAGVRVDGQVRRGRAPQGSRVLASRPSAPLAALATRILKDSDNFAAELLLKELGHTLRKDGSSRGGSLAVRGVLRRHGVPVGTGADGSGLSALNRQTPAGGLALLRAVSASGVAGPFRAAMPLACHDGTLRRRMCGTAAAGRLNAKTGTLHGVRALAGYTTTARGRGVRFVFQVSGARDGRRAQQALDRAAVVLATARE